MNLNDLDDLAMLERVAEQEARLVFERFDNEAAITVGTALLALGRERSLPIAIDVTRNGQCLFHCALDGASIDNAEWIKRKVKLVQRFARSSLYMGAECRLTGQSIEEKYLLPPNIYAAPGGAFPVTVRGVGVVGSVTVSGLPQIDDHELVVSVLEEYLAS